MKNRLQPILYLLFTIVMMASCYDDQSTEANRSLDEIIIDTTGIGDVLNIKFNQTLTVSPKIALGGTLHSSNLSYEWQMNISTSNEQELSVIGNEAVLSKKIINLPSTRPYKLILTVTDHTTGLQKRMLWDLYVNNSLGEGLIIATTADGGNTSDLSWLHCKEIAELYDGEDVVQKDLYSATNQQKIEGKVTALVQSYVTLSDRTPENRIYIGTDKSMLTIDPSSYRQNHRFSELFYAAPTESATSLIAHISQGSFICANQGKVYILSKTGAIDPKFGSPLNYGSTNYTADKYMAIETGESPLTTASFSYYDAVNGYLCDKQSGLAALFPLAKASAGTYDPTDLPNMEALGAGLGDAGKHYHFLKEKNAANYYVCTLKMDDNSDVVGDAKINISACKEITQSIMGIFNPIQNLMYYTTPEKIYAAYLNGTPSATAVFDVSSVDAGSHITHIQLFQQAWYLMCSDNAAQTPIAQNNRLLIATLYNPSTKEGKVVLLPIQDLNAGTLGTAKIFSGFSEITCIGVQSK